MGEDQSVLLDSSALDVNLALQVRRYEACMERLTRMELEVAKVARLNLEVEETQARDKMEKGIALASLTRRMEDSVMTCETLRRGQECLAQRVARLEGYVAVDTSDLEHVRELQKQV